jgi:hypothetical protein
MRRFLSRKPSPAMMVAFIALLAALSGSAIALPGRNTVDSDDIKKGNVKRSDIAKGAVTSGKVQDGSLLARDLKAGQLPAGPKGDTGPAGAKGEKGDKGDKGADGSPDTPEQVRDKLASVDGAGSGVDADRLDGLSSTEFVGGNGAVARGNAFGFATVNDDVALASGDVTIRMDCGATTVGLELVNSGGNNYTAYMDDGATTQSSTILVPGGVMPTRIESNTRTEGRGLLATWMVRDSAGRVVHITAAAYRDNFGGTVFCSAEVQALRTPA